MLSNILAVSAELQAQGYPKRIDISEAALYGLIGFVMVFFGIAFLIGIVYLVGKLMQTKNGNKSKKEVEKTVEKVETKPVIKNDETIDEETLAVITAAIMAYYEQVNPKCEFVVRRIKRIYYRSRC